MKSLNVYVFTFRIKSGCYCPQSKAAMVFDQMRKTYTSIHNLCVYPNCAGGLKNRDLQILWMLIIVFISSYIFACKYQPV